MQLSHDPLYVATAIAYALIGCAITMVLFGRAVNGDRQASAMWGAITGIVGGSTIWTSHFIGLLGVEGVENQLYYLFYALGSLLFATVLSAMGFVLASEEKTHRVVAGGLFVGSAIICSHVVSVNSINFLGAKGLDEARVAASAVTALLLGTAAVWLARRGRTGRDRMHAAVTLLVAILAVHFIGMAGFKSTVPSVPWMANIGISDRYLFAMVVFFGTMTLTLGGIVIMIDRRTASERVSELERMAFTDQLTSLPNRIRFERGFAAMSEGYLGKIVVVSFDLNRFKAVNDVHGHRVGDVVLGEIGRRLSLDSGTGELVCRRGGDEFAAFARGMNNEQSTRLYVDRLRRAVSADIEVGGHVISLGSSFGVAVYPDDGTDAADLIAKADMAMWRSRLSGDGQPIFYDAAIDEKNRDRSALSIELSHAVCKGQFELFFQKQNRIEDGRLMGYEVLLRWNHPERGYVSPEVFIPIAERDGHIQEIGEWVIKNACRAAAAWVVPIKIAVNVSARQLADDSLPEIVAEALSESGLTACRLEIELTESGIVADIEHARGIVGRLKGLGVSIAMDDYGMGYSSLNTLREFPFDKIKIDKAFVRDVDTNTDSAEIIKSTVALGIRLNKTVLAEGVETQAHIDFLKSAGCPQAQGYYFGKPIPLGMIASK